jgi:predicted GNAT family acetyltransferase
MTAVKDNPSLRRFELEEKGLIAFADYRRDGNHLVIPHVEAPPSLRGAGTAARLMSGIVDIARAEGFKVTPTCSYARIWFRRHQDAADVVGSS